MPESVNLYLQKSSHTEQNKTRITSKQIDSKTDSEGKLNVKITVSTEETLVKEEKPEEGTGEETTGE